MFEMGAKIEIDNKSIINTLVRKLKKKIIKCSLWLISKAILS